MKFAAIRDAILDKEKSNLDRDLRKKFLPTAVVEAKMKGLDICRKVRSVKELDLIIAARTKEEVKFAIKGDVAAYWDYRNATVEAQKVMLLLKGATDDNVKVGKRAAKELASAMGDER